MHRRVLLEQRYYGESRPFSDYNTDTYRFLDTEQALADNANFARSISFPEVDGSITSPGTPWIIVRQPAWTGLFSIERPHLSMVEATPAPRLLGHGSSTRMSSTGRLHRRPLSKGSCGIGTTSVSSGSPYEHDAQAQGCFQLAALIKYANQDCINALEDAISHLDDGLLSGDEAKVSTMLDNFGADNATSLAADLAYGHIGDCALRRVSFAVGAHRFDRAN